MRYRLSFQYMPSRMQYSPTTLNRVLGVYEHVTVEADSFEDAARKARGLPMLLGSGDEDPAIIILQLDEPIATPVSDINNHVALFRYHSLTRIYDVKDWEDPPTNG